MTLCSPRITRVALLTPCQLMEQGFERLLEEMADIRLSWCMESVTEASLRLITSPVEMLIVVISAHQAECQRHLQLIRALRRTRPGMKIVVILDVYIPYFLQLLAEQNVDGILSQHEPLEQLRDAISQVAEGGIYCSTRLEGALPEELSTAKPAALSLMELKVLQYLLQGCSIKRTANLLSRSEKTIMATKGKAMHKLGIKHSANLVAMREMLEYLYLEQIQSDGEQPDDRDDVVKGFQKHDSGANREIETLPSWLLPVDLIHSRVALIQ